MTSPSTGSRTVKVNPAPREVTGMAAQIGQVLSERHALVAASRRQYPGVADVLDARRPRSVVRLVVLWSERLETKPVSDEGRRGNEPGWEERARGHDEDATGRTVPWSGQSWRSEMPSACSPGMSAASRIGHSAGRVRSGTVSLDVGRLMDAATVLRPVVDAVLGTELPVRIECWDGSSSGPADAAAVVSSGRGGPSAD